LCIDQFCRQVSCRDYCRGAEGTIDRVLDSLEPVDENNECGLYQVVIDFPWSSFHTINIDWGDGTVETLGFGTTMHQFPDGITASYDVVVTITFSVHPN